MNHVHRAAGFYNKLGEVAQGTDVLDTTISDAESAGQLRVGIAVRVSPAPEEEEESRPRPSGHTPRANLPWECGSAYKARFSRPAGSPTI